ncbi:ATP-binding protein [Myxococcota bacterium]|nr:ATP-binding protein [Myxococcota bacterium]
MRALPLTSCALDEESSDTLSPWGSGVGDPEADERLRAIGRLSAGVSHELANQLTILAAVVAEITDATDAGEPVDREGLEALRHVHHRMSELCLGMRDLVRGRPLEVQGRAEVGAVVHQLVRVLDRVGLTRQLDVTVDALPTLSCVPLKAYALEQVLLNFVLNALAALELVSTKQLWITVRAEEATVEIEVRDSGPGLPRARVESLFDAALTGRIGGTGLGLQMAQRFAREAGGEAFARRPDEGGLAVGVRLPRIA